MYICTFSVHCYWNVRFMYTTLITYYIVICQFTFQFPVYMIMYIWNTQNSNVNNWIRARSWDGICIRNQDKNGSCFACTVYFMTIVLNWRASRCCFLQDSSIGKVFEFYRIQIPIPVQIITFSTDSNTFALRFRIPILIPIPIPTFLLGTHFLSQKVPQNRYTIKLIMVI
jgi:hypothetical protein